MEPWRLNLPIKTNIGGEPQEELLSSFPTQEEITKREAPTELSKDGTKDLLEHKNSSLLDHKNGCIDFQHFTVRLRAMFERLFGEEALDNLLELLNDRDYNNNTQRVLHGKIDSDGEPAFLSEENIGNVSLLATTVPALLAFANGFSDRRIIRYVKRVVADIEPDNWKNLLGLKKHFLFADYDLENDVLSYNKTPVPIQYAQKFGNPNLISTHSLLHFEEDGTPLDEYTDITWTVSGAVRSAVQKKFGTYSYLFDGANDYIETTDITDLQRPFTIELQFYMTDNTIQEVLLGTRTRFMFAYYRGNTTGFIHWYIGTTNAGFEIASNVSGAIAISQDAWHKLTFEWDGNFYRAYIDGVLDCEIASTTPIGIFTALQIGNENSNVAIAFKGYIDEFRLTVGNCRYGTAHSVETEAFTPDAQWFDTQNMKYYEGANGAWTEKKRLILGQANADRRVGALLHFNAAADTTDWTKLIDEYGNKWTFAGTAKLENSATIGVTANVTAKFGTRYLWVDGNSDYAFLDFGSNMLSFDEPWTMECWFCADVSQNNQTIFGVAKSGAPYYGAALIWNLAGNGKFNIYLDSGAGIWDIADGTGDALGSAQALIDGTWYKVTLEWNGSAYKFYFGGVLDITVTDSTAIRDCRYVDLGVWSGPTQYLNGGIDEFRLTIGHNQYGAAHAPETSEFSVEGTIDDVESYLVKDGYSRPALTGGTWYKVEKPSVGWKASKTVWATADNFDAGLEVTFSGVPAGAKAVRCIVYITGYAGYWRKSGDANISNTPGASIERSHCFSVTGAGGYQVELWLSSDYKVQLTVTNTAADLHVAYPVEYLI